MSCTKTSTLVSYNQTPITTRCGEVYCCEKFDNFLIHCESCSQQFNLLSCTLFIKHIKQCKLIELETHTLGDITSQDICNLSNKNDDQHIDPLMTIKLEVNKIDQQENVDEPMDNTEYLADYMDEDELPINQIISRKKIEFIIEEYQSHPILWDPKFSEAIIANEKEDHYRQITEAFNNKFNMSLTSTELQQQIFGFMKEYKTIIEEKQLTNSESGKTNLQPWYFEKLSFIQDSIDDMPIELFSAEETKFDSMDIQQSKTFGSSENNKQTQITDPFRDNCKDLNDRETILALIAQYKKYALLWDQSEPLYSKREARKDAYCKITDFINRNFNKSVTENDIKHQIGNLRKRYRKIFQVKSPLKPSERLWFFDQLSFVDQKTTEKENTKIPIEEVCLENPSSDQEYYDKEHQTGEENENDETVLEEEHVDKIESKSINLQTSNFENPSFFQDSDDDMQIEQLPVDEAEFDLTDNQLYKITDPFRQSCKDLFDRTTILELIDQYKKHALLWNTSEPLYSNRKARKDAYRKITEYISSKFNKKVTEKVVKHQIGNLRKRYRKIRQDKSHLEPSKRLWFFHHLSFVDIETTERENGEEEGHQTNDETIIDDQQLSNNESVKPNLQPSNFENLSCIQDSNDVMQIEQLSVDETKFDIRDNREKKITKRSRENCKDLFDRTTILALIAQYKTHTLLWDYSELLYTNQEARKDAYRQITEFINSKFKKNFTENVVKHQIANLRKRYRKIFQIESHLEPSKRLWFFNHLSFIDAEATERENGEEKEHQTSEESANDEVETFTQSQETEINFALIEEYKKHPCLYNNFRYEANSNYVNRTKNFTEIQKTINKKFNTNFTYSEIKLKINRLRSSYRRIYRKKEQFEKLHPNSNKKFRPQWKYFDKLSFIENHIDKFSTRQNILLKADEKSTDNHDDEQKYKPTDVSFVSCDKNTYESAIKIEFSSEDFHQAINKSPSGEDELHIMETKPELHIEEKNDITLNNENNSTLRDGSEGENMDQISCTKTRVISEDITLELIELYKKASILWDPNHPSYTLRTERRKSINEISNILSRNHECDFTVEDCRYHIRFLRETYFKALRHPIPSNTNDGDDSHNPKLLYIHRLSFLEPYFEKTLVQKFRYDIREPEADFTFLVENKSLMIDFIEVYKAHPCLWDSKHKDKHNLQLQLEAYDQIKNTFLKYDVKLTKELVLDAIRYLHFSFYKQKKINDEKSESDTTNEPSVWFFDKLSFLSTIQKTMKKYCSHCDQYFPSLAAYERHRIEIVGDFPYKCSVCNAGFVSRSKYAYHCRTHKEPHKCDQCDFQAYDKQNFNVHMRRHQGIHSFKCHECDKGFVTSTELIRHKRMHTGERQFVCEICGKTLIANSEFVRHMKRHNNVRDYKCKLCSSAFFTSKTLRDHMESHSTERKHVCETCGASFKRKKSLNQHKPLHAEKKKHECKICGKRFAQKAGVYSHMKSHGLIAPSGAKQ